MFSYREMIDLKDEIIKNLRRRRYPEEFISKVDNIYPQIEKVRNLTIEHQELQAKKNVLVKEGIKKKNEVIKINEIISIKEKEIGQLEIVLKEVISLIPNFLDDRVHDGDNDSHNIEIYRNRDGISIGKPHYEMGLIDSGSGTEMASSRFVILKGKIATLERALGNFLINFLISKGFTEVSIPLVLSSNSLYRTGHLPKEKENMFYIPEKDFYLIPTSECVLLNLMANKTINENEGPLKYTAFNVNFRKEAGSYGKDTRGLIRLHQFPKVEMVAFTSKEKGLEMFNHFIDNGKEALELLGLEYRIVQLCSGDTGFNSQITHDFEVWMSGTNEYREVSSISYCNNFQCKRLGAKYIDSGRNKEYLHALNGTCLGVGRILAAIMERYYKPESNRIHIPEVLHTYTNFTFIEL